MKQYLKLLEKVLEQGEKRGDRTGTGTLSLFGEQMRFNLEKGFPVVTTKKLYFNMVVDELLWFLSGSTNVNDIPERTRQIWEPWADEDGELGPVYGHNWRNWDVGLKENKYGARKRLAIDQIRTVINTIKNNPLSRRHIVSAWNVGELEDMALPPCHLLFQFYVRDGQYLDCQMYQRSADLFLGVPFNIASYSLLTHMIAQVCDLEAGEFVHTIGDAHIYLNHVEQVKKQLSREPYELPELWVNPDATDIDYFTFEDIELKNYKYHPAIKAPLAV